MKKTILVIIIFSIFLGGFLLFLDSTQAVNIESPGLLAGKSGKEGISWVIGRVIFGLLGIIGAITLIMFVYGGIVWLTSMGSSEGITKGKNVMIWAVVGLVIILFAYAATEFIIIALTGKPVPAPPQPPPPPPPPVTTPPPSPTDCLDGSAKDSNLCCTEFTKYPDKTNCNSAISGSLYRCCDCGKTNESKGFECEKNISSCGGYIDYNVVDSSGTNIGTIQIKKCKMGTTPVIRLTGHCGTSANHWCVLPEADLATSNLRDPSASPPAGGP